MSKILKNGSANLLRGGATAIVTMILPAILQRYFSDTISFSAWALILQFAAYISLLNFGIETAVSRFVAHYMAKNETDNCDQFCSTAWLVLWIAAGIAIILLGIAVYALPYLYASKIHSASLLREMQIGLFAIGLVMAINLPISVCSAIFIGLQRNFIPTVVIGTSRVTMVFIVWLTMLYYPTLLAACLSYAGVMLLAAIAQYVVYRQQQTQVHLDIRQWNRPSAIKLYHYCLSLSIWTLCMMVVNGIDLTILSQFRFQEVAYYSVAANLVFFIAGLQHALFSPLIARGAELSAQNETSGLAVAQLLVKSTRYAGLILWLTGLPLIIFAPHIFQLWMGGDYPQYASPILIILVFANIVRMISAPYAFLLIATGEQQKTILTPILEASSNLLFSLVLGWQFGAIGVAFGTLIGALVAVSGHIIYNARRTFEKISITPQALFFAWIKPSYYFLMLSILFICLEYRGFSSIWLKIGFCLVSIMIMIVVLQKDERDFILHKLGITKY